MNVVDYSTSSVPDDYKCHSCSIVGCKLWRESGFLPVKLECVDCAIKSQKDPKSCTSFSEKNYPIEVQEHGSYIDEYGMSCDQIGWLLPAVPTPDNESFWGYTSVPEDGVIWWKKLPLRIKK